MNRTLQPHGRFFVSDVVGESYFQFSDDKKNLFQTFMNATRDSSEPRVRIEWPSRENWTYSPFESVRSGDILDVFEKYLIPLRIRTAGAFLELVLFVRPDEQGGRLRRFARRVKSRLLGSELSVIRGVARGNLLFLMDSLMCDTGRLVPGQVFGVYGKRVN